MSPYVLVHGAGTGGWLWADVAGRLRRHGHAVFTPTLTGVGAALTATAPVVNLSDHVAEVVALIEDGELEDVVLVGFSYAGLVITGVAAKARPRVKRLVFLDAFLPRPGESFLDLLPSAARTAMLQAAEQHGEGRSVPPAQLEMIGGIGNLEPQVDEDHVLSVLHRRGFHPLDSYREKIPTDWDTTGLEQRFIYCTGKPPGDPLVALADHLGAQGIDVQTLPTGHFSMLSMPEALTALLL